MSFTQEFSYARALIVNPTIIPIVHKGLVSLEQFISGLVKGGHKGLLAGFLVHLRIVLTALNNQTSISLSRSKFI